MTGPYTEAELQAIADLIVAARNGHVDALKKTLATLEHVPTITHCILPDLEMEYVSPLAIAAEEGHEAIVDILLPSNKLDPSEDNAIAFAAKSGHISIFKKIWNTGAVSLADDESLALRLAAINNHLDILGFIFSLDNYGGADPSALNNEALRIVWERGQLDAAKMLVSTGKVDATYHDNEILLTYTALGHLDMVQYLVELPGIDPAVRDQKPLLLAVQGGFWDVVDFLLTLPTVNPAAFDSRVLRVACALGHVEVVRVLLRDGRVDVNAQESYPFYVACEKGHVEVVEALFDTGKVRLHEQGMDALFVSVKSDHPEVVRYLLSIGAAPKDVLSRNDDLKVAVMNAGNEVIGIFREHENVLTQPFRPAVIGEANENKKPGTRGGILREDSVSTQTVARSNSSRVSFGLFGGIPQDSGNLTENKRESPIPIIEDDVFVFGEMEESLDVRSKFKDFYERWEARYNGPKYIKDRISSFVASSFMSSTSLDRSVLLSTPSANNSPRMLEYVSSTFISYSSLVLSENSSDFGTAQVTRTLAVCLDLRLYRMDLASVKSVEDILGDKDAHVSSVFAKIAAFGASGCLVLFENFDKIDPTSQIAKTVLQILSSASSTFHDPFMGIEIDLQSSLFVLSTKNPSALPFSFLRLNKITHIEIPPAQVSHMAEYGWSTIVSEVMEWMGLSDDDRVHWHRDALDWICFVHLQGKCDFESIEKAIKIVLDAACVKLLLGVQQVDLTVDNVKSLLIPDMTFSTLWNDTRVGSAVFIGDDGLLHSLQIMLTDGDGVLSNSKDTVDPIIGVEFAKNWLRAHSSRFSKPDTKVLVQSSGQSDNGCMATAAAVALVSGTMNVQVSEKTVIICGLKLSGRLASPSSSQEIVMQRVIQAIDFGAKQIILSREEISQRVWESVPSGLKKDATVVFLDSFESLVKHMFGN